VPSLRSGKGRRGPGEMTIEIKPRGRENAREKGKRLLVSGRLRVIQVDGNLIVAECRGDSGEVYRLRHDPDDVPFWSCSCPARTACSHLHSLWAVVAVNR
jgi:uncharacterized Zn finger protein